MNKRGRRSGGVYDAIQESINNIDLSTYYTKTEADALLINKANSDDLNSEITRATTAEGTLQTNIDTKQDKLTAGDNITIDSDVHESPIRENIPFTNIGYVKATSTLLKRTKYLEMTGDSFVDPFEVAKITKDKEEMIIVLPSSNMSYKDQDSVRDGFRLALEEYFERISSELEDANASLKSTLFWLA